MRFISVLHDGFREALHTGGYGLETVPTRNLLERIIRRVSYVTNPWSISYELFPVFGRSNHCDNDKGLELLVNPGSLGEDTRAEIRD